MDASGSPELVSPRGVPMGRFRLRAQYFRAQIENRERVGAVPAPIAPQHISSRGDVQDLWGRVPAPIAP